MTVRRTAFALLATAAVLGAMPASRAETVPGGCGEPGDGAVASVVRSIHEAAARTGLVSPPRSLRDCPPGTGFRPLSSIHAPKEIFVGTFPDPRFATYAREMADAVARVAPDVKVNVLVNPSPPADGTKPKGPAGNPALFDFAKSAPYSSRVRLIEAQGSPIAVQWPQDGLELGVTGADAKPAAIEFYPGAAKDLAPVTGIADATPLSYTGVGGDLEAFPGGVVVTGSDTKSETNRALARGSGDRPVEVDTSWLRIGHVDEIFSVVPTGDEPCDFAIAHASPAAGLALLDRLPDDTPIEPPGVGRAPGEKSFGERHTSADCVADLPSNSWGMSPLTAGAAKACPQFGDINRGFEAKVQEGLAKIRDAVERKTGCKQPPTIAVPQLFRPSVPGGPAEAVNVNAVNSVVLGRSIIAGEQPNDLFRDEIRARYAAAGVRVEYVDARMFHFNGGTVHCSTNVLRTCE